MPKWQNLRGKKPTNTPKWPSTRVEVEGRIMQVWKFLIQGYQRAEIIELIKEEHSVSTQQIDKYIKTATERIREKNNENLDEERALAKARILDIYQWARKENKWWDALKAIKMDIEMKWLDVPPKNSLIWGRTVAEIIEEWAQQYRELLLKRKEKLKSAELEHPEIHLPKDWRWNSL